MDFIFYGENMDDLPIISKGEIDIYSSDIDYLRKEYISLLDDPSLIYKSSCFQGLLEYIYNHLLKNIIRKENGYNYDYVVLNTIYDNIYIPLCNIYSITPTLIMFCVNLCHIDYSMIRDIKDGVLRNGIQVNNDIKDMVKHWNNVSESSLVSKTIEHNSIGSIFTLKSLYHYSDNAPQTIEITTSQSHQTVDEIRQKYASAFLPDKEELQDNLDSINYDEM